jgi:hypothetical protein
MAALDFPASPIAGDKYPVPAVVGQPQYTYDGTKWTTVGAQVTTAAPAAAVPLMDQATGLVGTATKYAREDHVHPKFAAAPMDALAYSGMQINGSMEVNQGGGAATITNGANYVLDGFGVAMVGAAATATPAQIGISSLAGFPYCLGFQCTVANPLTESLSGSFIYQIIEGYRWARLSFGGQNAQPVTIGFWVFPNISGTMGVSIRGSDRSYVVDVPITAGAWQFKTVTIPGCTDGTWLSTNGLGATIGFCFGAGSGRKAAAANAWNTNANAVGSPATTNFFASPGVIYFTGVVVLPGSEAPSAARSALIMRPYDQELVTCQRYLDIGQIMMQVPAAASMTQTRPWNRTMRAAPTVTMTVLDPGNAGGAITNNSASVDMGAFQLASTIAGGYARWAYKADARL